MSNDATQTRRALRAAGAYFGIVFGAGFLLGSIRVPLLVPRLGERWAELLEMPVMLTVIVFAARFVVGRFGLARSQAPRLVTGIVALVLLIGAELMLAVMLQGRGVGDYIASRDPVSGSVYLVVLGLFAAMPGLLAWFGADPVSPAAAAAEGVVSRRGRPGRGPDGSA